MRRFFAALLSVTIAGGCATTKQPIESEETIAAQEARVRALKTDVSTLTRTGETLDREIVALEKRIAWRDEAIERLSKDINDTRVLEERLKQVKFHFDPYGGPRAIALRRLPDGVVRSIEGDAGKTFVVISVGSKDGVRLDDEYHVSRGSHYVGRIKIVSVKKSEARGLADKRWTGQAWPPRPFDKVWAECVPALLVAAFGCAQSTLREENAELDEQFQADITRLEKRNKERESRIEELERKLVERHRELLELTKESADVWNLVKALGEDEC